MMQGKITNTDTVSTLADTSRILEVRKQVFNDPKLVKWDKPIVIDFETYYDKNYSLSKITMERYIRGAEFECIGLSIKDGASPDADAVFYKLDTWLPVLKELLADPLRPVVCHNFYFDIPILAWRYGITPVLAFDTSSMAKTLRLDAVLGGTSLAKCSEWLMDNDLFTKHKGTAVRDMLGVHAADMTDKQWEDYADYCTLDSEICYQLYKTLLPMLPVDEVLASNIVLEMFTEPKFVVDTELLKNYRDQLENDKDSRLDLIADRVGVQNKDELLGILRSSSKFADLLTRLDVEVPTKYSPKQDKYIPAVSKTDKEFLDLAKNHENELVRDVCAVKLGSMSSMEQTRTDTFLDIASRGKFPVHLNYAAAHTHRLGGGSGQNLQNLTKRSKEPVLRRSLTADGGVVIATDLSSVEARINAMISCQDDLIRLFQTGGDPYVDMASAIFNMPYDEIYRLAKVEHTKDGKQMRAVGKQACLACGYGMSANTFRERMLLAGDTFAASMAEIIVTAYRNRNDKIADFWRVCDTALKVLSAGHAYSFGGKNNNIFYAYQYEILGDKLPAIRLPNGTHLVYKNLRMASGGGFEYDQLKQGKWQTSKMFGAKLTENLCQALSFCVLKWQAIEIAKQGIPLHLNVHDEWVSVVPREAAARTVIGHYKAMTSVPSYIQKGLIDCEVSIGRNYADLEELDKKLIKKFKKFV